MKSPKTEKEKTLLAQELYEAIKSCETTRENLNLIEAEKLYYFNKYDLHNYLFGESITKKAFYEEIDIPWSTANYRLKIYEFYVIKHGIKHEDLLKAAGRKLYAGLPYLKDKDTAKVLEAVELAERGKQGISDFLISIGAKENYCVHEHKTNETVSVCKDCGKKVVV